MRHSIKERMSMTKETLTLKTKSTEDLTTPSIKAEAATSVTGGKKPNNGNAKSPKAVMRLIESAISNKAYVFIQLRHGAGYRGLPTMIADSWLTLQDADIYGTKQNMHVAELLIQVKDGSYIAHIHTSESQDPLKDFDTAAGELK
jgi:hypothetical protein